VSRSYSTPPSKTRIARISRGQKEVNFTTTNLQLRTKKKNNLGHPTLPLYSITYLLNTKLASFGIFCQLWQKFVFARECHQKEIDDDVSVSPEKFCFPRSLLGLPKSNRKTSTVQNLILGPAISNVAVHSGFELFNFNGQD